MLTELIKSFLVGFCVAVPAGPVLLFVMHKTFHYGRWAGISAGAGSALIDAAYSALGLFALSLVTDFIMSHEAIITVAGGIAIALIGYKMSRQDVNNARRTSIQRYSAPGFAVQAMGLVISNPGALGAMMAALAIARLSSDAISIPVWTVPVMVFVGELTYWALLSFIADRYITITKERLGKISVFSGIIIMIVGIVLLIKGIIEFI